MADSECNDNPTQPTASHVICEHAGEQPTADTSPIQLPPPPFTADFTPPGRPRGCLFKKPVNRHKNAEQSEVYRKQISETMLQNADFLLAYANHAAEITPSAAEPLKYVLAGYALSSASQIAKF